MGNAEDSERWRPMPVLLWRYGLNSATNAWQRKGGSPSPLAGALLSGIRAEEFGR